MQKYLMPNDIKMKKEDCEQNFNIRSRAKINQKNRYDTYECEACEIADALCTM
jgi:hypothetical protein